MATPSRISERSYYEPVKASLEQTLKEKYANVHLEVTAFGQFSGELTSQISPYRELVFAFLKEAPPDITGFVRQDSSSLAEFLVVEVKAVPIKLDDIYQVRKYAELFDAKNALLLSSSEIPDKIKRLSARVVPSLLSLHGGYGKVTLARFDEENGTVFKWFPECPFK